MPYFTGKVARRPALLCRFFRPWGHLLLGPARSALERRRTELQL